MIKRIVEWNWDKKAKNFLFEELERLVLNVSSRVEGPRVLDIGGMTGKMAKKSGLSFPICIDINPKHRYKKVHYVKGNILNLPFEKNSFDLVIAKAILHHVPTKLDEALDEILRVTKSGGFLLIEEPSSKNLFASSIRKFITTTQHDEDERPLNPQIIKKMIKNRFSEVKTYHFFPLTYLFPHFIARVPEPFKPVLRKLTQKLYSCENLFIDKSIFFRKRAAYFAVIARKK